VTNCQCRYLAALFSELFSLLLWFFVANKARSSNNFEVFTTNLFAAYLNTLHQIELIHLNLLTFLHIFE